LGNSQPSPALRNQVGQVVADRNGSLLAAFAVDQDLAGVTVDVAGMNLGDFSSSQPALRR